MNRRKGVQPDRDCVCFFVSDLHGSRDRYNKLFRLIRLEKPDAVFIGGDLLPPGLVLRSSRIGPVHQDFIHEFLFMRLSRLRAEMGEEYPTFFLILGNDDGRFEESSILDVATSGVWHYIHNRHIHWCDYLVFGYAYVPPTPFLLKDWERYDVSRYVDVGSVSPEEGVYSIPVSDYERRYATIQDDLASFTRGYDVSRGIFLFHAPPYKTNLDRAALDNKMIDHAPLDVYIGSMAIRRFIEEKQPFITLHGHVHESARITGQWKDRIGKTWMFSAAHDGSELALVRFRPSAPEKASRALI